MTTNQQIKSNPTKDTLVFFAITLGLSYLVFWGPLAFFQITAISFVDNKMGPTWAIILFMMGGFVPSLVAITLTGVKEGKSGLNQLWRRVIQVRIGLRWYLVAIGLIVFGSASQIMINFLLGHSFDFSLFLIQLPSLLPLIVLGAALRRTWLARLRSDTTTNALESVDFGCGRWDSLGILASATVPDSGYISTRIESSVHWLFLWNDCRFSSICLVAEPHP